MLLNMALWATTATILGGGPNSHLEASAKPMTCPDSKSGVSILQRCHDCDRTHFEFQPDGTVKLNRDGPARTLSFPDTTGDKQVAIYGVWGPESKDGKPARTLLINCRLTTEKSAWKLALPFFSLPEGSLIEVQVLWKPSGEDLKTYKKAIDSRRKELMELLEPSESAELAIRTDFSKVGPLLGTYLAHPNADKSPLKTALTATETELAKLASSRCATSSASSKDPFVQFVAQTCKEQERLTTLHQVLSKALDEGDRPTLLSRAPDVPQVETDQEIESRREQACKVANVFAGLGTESVPAVFGHATLPLLAPSRVLDTLYGFGYKRFTNVPAGKVAVVAHAVPSGQPLSTEVRKRESVVNKQLPDVLRDFIPLAMGGLRATTPKFSPEVPIPPVLSCPSLKPSPDFTGHSLTERQTFTHVIDGFDSSAVHELLLCAKQPCPADAKDASVKNRIELVPGRGLHFSLHAALAIHGAEGPGGFRVRGPLSPVFEPVGDFAGPEQTYQLRYASELRQAFSTSVLLTLQGPLLAWLSNLTGWPGEHPSLMIGVGPTLLGSGGALTEWNARGGIELFSSGVYFTMGASFRGIKQATNFREGDLIVISRAAAEQGALPTIHTREVFNMSYTLGLSIDTAALTSGAADLVQAIGGSAK